MSKDTTTLECGFCGVTGEIPNKEIKAKAAEHRARKGVCKKCHAEGNEAKPVVTKATSRPRSDTVTVVCANKVCTNGPAEIVPERIIIRGVEQVIRPASTKATRARISLPRAEAVKGTMNLACSDSCVAEIAARKEAQK